MKKIKVILVINKMIVYLIMMMLMYLKVNKNNNHKEYLMKIE